MKTGRNHNTRCTHIRVNICIYGVGQGSGYGPCHDTGHGPCHGLGHGHGTFEAINSQGAR